jgi:hypothetical protein
MTTTTIRPGALVEVRTAFGNVLRRRAVTGPEMSDFLIVRVCTEDEWEAAEEAGRKPSTTPWPAEDVWPVE